jgi:hypothetical protein
MIRDYKIIAVDFDQTLFFTDFPEIYHPKMEVINKVKEEIDKGNKIILWTCRCGEFLEDAIEACKEYGIYFDAINENLPEIVKNYKTDSRKIVADEYWDDKAIRIN